MIGLLDTVGTQMGVIAPWLDDAGRLIIASVATLGLLAIIFGYLLVVPKSPEPATWAQSMAGAVLVFALMLLGYGVIPSEWIIFANSHLRWDEGQNIFNQNSVIPFEVSKAVARDLVAVGIYAFFVVVNGVMFVMWQKRKTSEQREKEAATAEPTGTSAFGRPMTKRA